MPESVADIKGLVVRYGRREILRGLDLSLAPGEVLALLGRNGAGKSTLVRCLLGLERPAAGRLRLLERDVWRHRAELMAEVAAVPERPDAPPGWTATRLARATARFDPSFDAPDFAARLERRAVPVDTPFDALSRGQATQVSLALALARRPRLLVLDDPTLGLDPTTRLEVLEELAAELAERELSMLMTGHDLPGVERLASRVALLADGLLVLDEDVAALRERHRWVATPRPEDAELTAPFEPIVQRPWGRGHETLVARYDDRAASRLGAASQIRWASLEDIVVASSHQVAAPRNP
ncbi:MAG: ABC transporter ATP-binding protein [Acidobacteriota bacterium]